MRQKAMNTEKNVMNVIQLSFGGGGWMDAECSIFRVFVFQRRVSVLLLCTIKRIKSIAKVEKSQPKARLIVHRMSVTQTH